jgi:hypothetical protein
MADIGVYLSPSTKEADLSANINEKAFSLAGSDANALNYELL